MGNGTWIENGLGVGILFGNGTGTRIGMGLPIRQSVLDAFPGLSPGQSIFSLVALRTSPYKKRKNI